MFKISCLGVIAMKKIGFYSLLFFTCLALLFTVKTAYAETINAPTSITTDTVWSNVYTYVVQTTTTVQPGVNLTIEPGTVIKLKTNAKMVIKGTLEAPGSDQNNIVMTRNLSKGSVAIPVMVYL